MQDTPPLPFPITSVIQQRTCEKVDLPHPLVLYDLYRILLDTMSANSAEACCYRQPCICCKQNVLNSLDDSLSKTDTDLLLSSLEAHKVFWDALNPKRFGEPGRRVFTEDLSDSDVLGAFHVQGCTYHTVWPDNCPQNIKHDGSGSVKQDLKVFVVMPKILRTCSKKVRIMVDFHGGGGVSVYRW